MQYCGRHFDASEIQIIRELIGKREAVAHGFGVAVA
jgi:hypothetical protein